MSSVVPIPEALRALGMDFVPVPAGVHWIGSRDPDARAQEEPRRRIRLSRTIWMATTPVTQGQWAAVMPTDIQAQMTKWRDSAVGIGDWHPMYSVNWTESVAYCNALNRAVGLADWISAKEDATANAGLLAGRGGFRLPTEAEWEVACRAGTATAYSGGDGEAALDAVEWYTANSGGETHRVADKPANGWGLYDMHGNVWEWCLDGWDAVAPRKQADGVVDPIGIGIGPLRVYRGGSWFDSAARCRSAVRDGNLPGIAYRFQGFRLVWAPSPSRRAQVPEGQKAEAERAERGERAELPAGAGAGE